jgi:hypothetical protein
MVVIYQKILYIAPNLYAIHVISRSFSGPYQFDSTNDIHPFVFKKSRL